MAKSQFHNKEYIVKMSDADVNAVQAIDYEYNARKSVLKYAENHITDLSPEVKEIYRVESIGFWIDLQKILDDMYIKYAGKQPSRLTSIITVDFKEKVIKWTEREMIHEKEN